MTSATTRQQRHETQRPETRRIGPYRVLRRLADGGMGRLYVAQHPELPRQVVLKTLRASWIDDDQAVARLRREAEILGHLDHPGVLRILDVLRVDGQLVLVLPFVEGASLREHLDAARSEQPAPPGLDLEDVDAVLRLVERTARAVHEVHQQGVVHRDLKPGNVMVQPDGRPVVLDFGLAIEPSVETAKLTLAGQRVGTPPYMAPEQIRGEESTIGPASDVYALCTLLYELLSGQRAFPGDQLDAVYDRVLGGRWDRDALPRKLPRDLVAVLEKGLALEPDRRYASAFELAEELRRLRVGEATQARPERSSGRLWRVVRRHPWTSLLGASTLLFAVAAAALGLTAYEQHRLLEAAEEYHLDATRGQEAPARVVEALRSQMPTKESAEVFLNRPADAASLDRWLDSAMPSLELRAGAEVETDAEASARFQAALNALAAQARGARRPIRITPAGATLEARPTARCELEVASEGAWACDLTDHDGEVVYRCRRRGDDTARSLDFELPEGLELRPNRPYHWRFRFTGRLEDTEVEDLRIEAPITRIDRAELRRQLAGYDPAAPPSLNQLPRAAVLLSLGLPDESVRELESIGPEPRSFERSHRSLLAAYAHRMRGDEERARACRDRYLSALQR